MAEQLLDTLRWQFRLTWQLAQYHLPQLTDDACLWEPAPGSWTVRQAGGVWQPDWADAEPDPVLPVTIGWLAWHIIWWWSGLIAAVRDAWANSELMKNIAEIGAVRHAFGMRSSANNPAQRGLNSQ